MTAPMDCSKCGQTHTRCHGHPSSGEQRPCMAYPKGAATVCRKHGGAAPQVRNAATVRETLARTREAVATLGLPVTIDPTDALLEEVYRTAGHVRWLEERVRELDPESLTWGRTIRKDIGAGEFPGVDVTEAAVVNAVVALYQAERKHLLDVCKTAIGLGIEERRVRLAEAQGELAGQALRAILAGLNLSREQRDRVPDLVREHFTVTLPA